ncbi:MAG TPA: response regulator transcription factor [Kiritimatiellia bacterium]|nr:response regulator transcription factor [Kiritimatiellia bacterium]HSA19662.1 response regulator transcription factor [Kiritimatiellia bacterium]
MFRVLLVDDHAVVRHGLAALLAGEPDLAVCGEAGTVAEALAAADSLRPDVAIVDITLKDENGLDFVREARRRGLVFPMLVLSMHDEATHAEKALRAGAQGYVMKEQGDECLLAALHAVLKGETYLSDAARARMLQDYLHKDGAAKPETGIESLTDREREIFECLGRGMTTRRIAEKYSISERTVEVHRAHIKRKLGCEDAAQLLREAVRWVEDQSA